MGYYSDIAFVLSPEAAQKLDHLLRQEAEDSDNTQAIRYAETTRESADGSRLYYWDLVKWYPEFPEIAWIEDFRDSLPSDDFLFIRLGEYLNDVEELGTYYGNPFGVSVHREITFHN